MQYHVSFMCTHDASLPKIFDPIRVVMVEGKMEDWFDFKSMSRSRIFRIVWHPLTRHEYAEFAIYKWLRENTVDRFSFATDSEGSSLASPGVWKERQEAEDALQKYLTDFPSMSFETSLQPIHSRR